MPSLLLRRVYSSRYLLAALLTPAARGTANRSNWAIMAPRHRHCFTYRSTLVVELRCVDLHVICLGLNAGYTYLVICEIAI
ncbi:hypothetical protein ACQKWADRAFT_136789 [Trichoderma austrokoningii]